jgi:hypothetical protein
MLDLNAPFNRCVECNEVITNPICSSCLSQSMRDMVSQNDPELAKEIIGVEVLGDTCCIRCGNKMGLCAPCFSYDIYNFLETRNKLLAQDFMGRFDFDLRNQLVNFD